jgi:hypothetical protein
MKKIIYYLISFFLSSFGAFIGLLLDVPLWKGAIISFAGLVIVAFINAILKTITDILSNLK